MIKLFRTLNPLNIILLVVLALLFRTGILLRLPEKLHVEYFEAFGKLLIPLPEYVLSPLGNVLVSTGLVLVQALLLNRIVNFHNLLGKPSYLPALLYVTATSLFLPFQILSPALLCNFLLIGVISKFLGIHKQGGVIPVMYDTGMIIGIGTIIYFPFIAMVLTLWFCLLIFRPFNWREWTAGLVGFITIFFFIAVFYYWNDALDKFYQIWLPLTSRFPTRLNINIYNYLVLIPVIVIMILAGLHLRQKFFRSFVQVRKSFQLLLLMFIVAALSFYLKADHPMYHFILMVPMGAVFMAYYFLNASIRWFYEGMYLVLVAAIIYFQFS